MTTDINPYEAKTVAEVLTEFKVQTAEGLPLAEIQARQTSYGLNEVPEESPSMIFLLGKHFWGLTAFIRRARSAPMLSLVCLNKKIILSPHAVVRMFK
jgi:hypothetical protein